MKECDDKQIYSISTNRCINIDSPTFNKRLKEQLEKNVKHFNSSDLKKLGYKVKRKNVKRGGAPDDKEPKSNAHRNAANSIISQNTNSNTHRNANSRTPQSIISQNANSIISQNANSRTPQNVANSRTPQNTSIILQNTSIIPQNDTFCTHTNETISDETKKMLLKLRDELNDKKYEYRFVNDNQKEYCNKGKNVLLDNPLITDTITYNFTYLKSDLQGTFDKKMLLYNNNEPWEVALISNTGAPKIELNLLNYDRMNPFTDDVRNKFIDQLDIGWFNKTNKYVSNLNIEDLFAIKAYTYNGDVFINNRLRNLEPDEMNKCLKTISGDKYVKQQRTYFPLFFPILEIIFAEDDMKKLIDEKKVKDFDAANTDVQPIKNTNVQPIKNTNVQPIKNTNVQPIKDTLYELIINIKEYKDLNNTELKDITPGYMQYFNQTDRSKLYIIIVLVARILKEEIVIKAIDKLILKLNEIIKKSPPTEKKMIVYRGDKTDTYFKNDTKNKTDTYFKNDTKNKFFKNKGFISTTLSYVNATIFTDGNNLDKSLKTSEDCCMKEITILPGSKLLFVGGVSTVPREIEFVLGTNTTYLMRKYRDKVYGKDNMHCNHGNTRPTTLMTRLVALEDCRKE
jgi:hypothetical protein